MSNTQATTTATATATAAATHSGDVVAQIEAQIEATHNHNTVMEYNIETAIKNAIALITKVAEFTLGNQDHNSVMGSTSSAMMKALVITAMGGDNYPTTQEVKAENFDRLPGGDNFRASVITGLKIAGEALLNDIHTKYPGKVSKKTGEATRSKEYAKINVYVCSVRNVAEYLLSGGNTSDNPRDLLPPAEIVAGKGDKAPTYRGVQGLVEIAENGSFRTISDKYVPKNWRNPTVQPTKEEVDEIKALQIIANDKTEETTGFRAVFEKMGGVEAFHEKASEKHLESALELGREIAERNAKDDFERLEQEQFTSVEDYLVGLPKDDFERMLRLVASRRISD